MNKKRFFIVTCIYSQYAIMQEGNTVKRDLSTNINKIIILMKILLRITLGLLFLTLPFSLFSENKIKDPTIRVLNFQELHPLLQLENDTIYVMNFWATWCAPCIKEIQYFEQLSQKYRDKNLKVLMVSLDFPDQLQTSLIPFIKKKNMINEVVLLDDPNSNHWIPLVDEKWTGAIPATLIYGKNFREFYQQEFIFSELEEIVLPLLSN